MSNKTKKKRTVFLIDPKFQWTVIAYFSAMIAAILTTIYAFFYLGFMRFRQFGLEAGLPKDNIYFHFIHMQEELFLKVVIAISIVVGLMLIFGGIYISQKIAGPIYRLKKELNSMSEDPHPELKAINFRKGDFFMEVPVAFNKLVDAIQRKNSKEK